MSLYSLFKGHFLAHNIPYRYYTEKGKLRINETEYVYSISIQEE